MAKRRWQKGSVLVRGDVLRIQYRDATGRQVSETMGRFSKGQTREDARAELAARVRAVAKESYVHRHTDEPGVPLFEEWAKKWVDRKERLGLDPRTARNYERKLTKHCARFHGVPLNEIQRQDVNALIGDLLDHPYAPRTINHSVTVLHGLVSAAVREGLLDVNPAKETDRPSIKKYPARPLTPKEIERVRHHLDTPRFLSSTTQRFCSGCAAWRQKDCAGRPLTSRAEGCAWRTPRRRRASVS
jgi:Phage integrase SAM-like domain